MKLLSKKSYLLLVFSALAVLFPVFILVLWSFSDKWMYPAVFPQAMDLKIVRQMVKEPNFFRQLLIV